jgi:uncharacterized protein involved in type VI secretion and phage assembly
VFYARLRNTFKNIGASMIDQDLTNENPRQALGKHRGIVVNNVDPMQLGRVQVALPGLGSEKNGIWAMPCVPYAGKGVGFFAMPSVGTNVWVEFENGNPDRPIWAGCFWGKGEVPLPSAAEVKTLTTEQSAITLDDTSEGAGITIETKAGMKIVITASGIEIDNGQGGNIRITGPKVSVNGGALEVI